jgi:hypothetical protein
MPIVGFLKTFLEEIVEGVSIIDLRYNSKVKTASNHRRTQSSLQDNLDGWKKTINKT